jgi:hypothetical protein
MSACGVILFLILTTTAAAMYLVMLTFYIFLFGLMIDSFIKIPPVE